MKTIIISIITLLAVCACIISLDTSTSSANKNKNKNNNLINDLSSSSSRDVDTNNDFHNLVQSITPSPPMIGVTETPAAFDMDKLRKERILVNKLRDKEIRNWKPEQVRAAIILVAKVESRYIAHFVKYHIALGFEKIFIYDNEDEATYERLLLNNSIHPSYFKVHHIPGNTIARPQILGIHHFEANYMQTGEYTHASHFDGDEFITLRKHNSINDFISDYFVGNVAAVAMNWRYFGSAGRKKYEDIPYPVRFTRAQQGVDHHVKSIFQTDRIERGSLNAHYVIPKVGFCEIDSNYNPEGFPLWSNFRRPADVIHLNHYKSKTFEEFVWSTERGRADAFKNEKTRILVKPHQRVKTFHRYNHNAVEDLVTHDFWMKHVESFDFTKPRRRRKLN